MILVTGSSGFVGQQLIKTVLKSGHVVKGVGRNSTQVSSSPNYHHHVIDDFSATLDWQKALQGVNVIIHTIARVHIMDETVINPIDAYRACNVDATLNLAKQAAANGTKRFIFISSIKVNGESTEQGVPFTENDRFIPSDPYGLSKYEAEQALLELGKQTGMEIVIIRPPLIYGPGVKANFAKMMKWVKKGIPLPFGAVNNLRSLVALDNLIDFVDLCVTHPKAANEIFLISDGEDISTTALLNKVARAYNKKATLLPIPTSLMTFVANLLGKSAITDRLFGSLQVDNSKARDLLGWVPVISMDDQLVKIVECEKQ